MKTYPIAEIFTSPQGEGVYTGALMTFVRLAGCNVGKPYPKERYSTQHDSYCPVARNIQDERCTCQSVLPIYTEMCTTYDGRTFECDTDYRRKEFLNVDQIIERLHEGIQHVCLTGGEPLLHDLSDLLDVLEDNVIKAHIETSGTIVPTKHAWWNGYNIDSPWITVSPKKGVLPEVIERADEVKLLIDADFDIDKVPQFILNHDCVFIQPINFEHKINDENLERCKKLQLQHPHFRISTQMHKVWNVR